jgi:hypothetical protein
MELETDAAPPKGAAVIALRRDAPFLFTPRRGNTFMLKTVFSFTHCSAGESVI